MKKIAIFNDSLCMGGVERVLINYLKNLSKESELEITLIIKENIPEKNVFLLEVPTNIKVKFITTENQSLKMERLQKNKKNKFLGKVHYEVSTFFNNKNIKRWIGNYFNENKFESVIDFKGSMWRYLKNIDIPTIGWIHLSLKEGIEQPKKYKKYLKKFKLYKYIVSICDDMSSEIENSFPQFKDKLIRIYNPMDLELILKKSEDISELSSHEKDILKTDFFVAVSRLASIKNIISMIEIYDELRKKGVKEKLYILGDGEERVNIEKKITEFSLENDVILLGERKNPFPFIKNAKLFLHTSSLEGLPTVFIEAMLLGTVVVAYDCPTGPREILNNGKAGGLIQFGNQENFVNKIIEILENKEIKTRIEIEMQNKIEEFSYETIREVFFKLLRK